MIALQFISGLMFGVEVIWGEGFVLDLGIIRVLFIWSNNNDE